MELKKMMDWKEQVRDELIEALALDKFDDVDRWLSVYKMLNFKIRQYVKLR